MHLLTFEWISIGRFIKLVLRKTIIQTNPMLIKTLLNKCHRLKSFVYVNVLFEWIGAQECVVAEVAPRKNSRARCSYCKRHCPGYDRQATRVFEFIPIWGYKVFLRYAPRRVECPEHGVVVEHMPWAIGKSPVCRAYKIFLARWAKKLSWKEVAESFRTSWDSVFVSVKFVVEYGLANRSMDGIQSIGVDEWHYRHGMKNFATLVYQIDADKIRLLFIEKGRCVKSLLRFFQDLGKEHCEQIEYVCSDMWKPYLKVIKKKVPQALHILDRFHIVANLNKAINEVRAAEAKRLKKEGYDDVLKNSKYCFLKNPENLTDNQRAKLDKVVQYDLKSVRAYLLKESFQLLWTYSSTYWAGWYLEKWCKRAMRSRLDPIKKFANSMRKHHTLILNYFKAKKQLSSGVVEGLNRKVNLITRKAYGFRNFENLKIALFHTMGDLPEPNPTHEFF